MLPITLELRNFLAYRTPQTVRFDGIHLACLTGANGAGKSSLLDAITWALWGKARARDDELVYHDETEMTVQLDFEQEGQSYRVLRRRSRKGAGSGTLDLYVRNPDGGWQTMNGNRKTDTQKVIERLLRMSYDTFVHSAFLQQGKADAFTTLGPAERKRVLGEILDLARWTRYELAVKEALKLLEDETNTLNGRLQQIEQELQREPVLRAELQQAEAAHAQAEVALAQAEAALAELQHIPGEITRNQAALREADAARLKCERDLQVVDGKIAGERAEIAKLEQVLAREGEITEGYRGLQDARTQNADFSQKQSQLMTLEQRQREIEKTLEAERAAIDKQIAQWNTRIDQYDREIAAGDPQAYEALADQVRALDVKADEKAEREQALAALTQEHSELKGRNTAIVPNSQKLRDRINRLKELQGECPLCGQPLTEAHRTQVTDELEAEGRGMKAEYEANIASIAELEQQAGFIRQQISTLDKALTQGKGLRDKAAQMQAAVHKAGQALAERAALVMKRDDQQQRLDSGSFGAAQRAALAAITAEREVLGYDRARHDALRQSVQQYEAYDEDYRKLSSARDMLPVRQQALTDALARQSELSEALARCQHTQEALQTEALALQGQMLTYNQRREAQRTARQAEISARERKVSAEQAVRVLDEQRRKSEEVRAERDALKERSSQLEQLRTAFGRNGVPAMIIEQAIPELEDAANALLSAMTDGRMSLGLKTTKERVTGGAAETLEIAISDELGTRGYELYSGGEAFRINFALRVALSQLLARRSGAHLRTLFIDEGFGTQDEEGRGKLVDAITRIQDRFDLILVITHMDDLRDSFPVHLQIEKTASGSTVTLR
jgi:exonuclease SbcC